MSPITVAGGEALIRSDSARKPFWKAQTEGIGKMNFWLVLLFVLGFASLTSGNSKGISRELLLNLPAETLGVWLAVVLIGEVMRRDQEDAKGKP